MKMLHVVEFSFTKLKTPNPKHQIKNKYQVRVIAGDKTTTIDRDRILEKGVQSVQIETGTCHLDAFQIKKALMELRAFLQFYIL